MLEKSCTSSSKVTIEVKSHRRVRFWLINKTFIFYQIYEEVKSTKCYVQGGRKLPLKAQA